ncbi:dephospho-CoA kinase [Leucobacter sp. wl10]|uniref:dephospho-CoA kinase n=1 Tax=Leucobacter sp. wl10 TaxID=2304677 RepID=UPI000E5BC199|nr:dephospho-CoA kinase [Leucobacter sp. wl10]RGE22494.1 dephospho-CoA kinase [Leucobacter sp. wl10]
MKLIGLSGGIASGKSTIGRRLEQLGAVLIDADELAREAVAPGSPGLGGVVDRFGAGVLRGDGSLDRSALGAIVFGDEAALAALNAVVHPEVRRLFAARVAEARDRDPEAIVVYDVPLLVEAARDQAWDLVVIAEAPAEQRIARMVELRGMSETDARNRIARQASDAERRAVADVVIDTSGSKARTLSQVDELWRRITSG